VILVSSITLFDQESLKCLLYFVGYIYKDFTSFLNCRYRILLHLLVCITYRVHFILKSSSLNDFTSFNGF